jgi:CopG family transcriptional regulator, nickel-responsive regulator
MAVRRFGVSLEDHLLDELDKFVNENRFPNRSQGIRYLIENNLVEKKWQSNDVVAGAVVVVYDHHRNDINNQMNELQHDYYSLILSTQHIHLDHDLCLESIAVKGKAHELTELADKIIALKGIKHGRLVMSRAD